MTILSRMMTISALSVTVMGVGMPIARAQDTATCKVTKVSDRQLLFETNGKSVVVLGYNHVEPLKVADLASRFEKLFSNSTANQCEKVTEDLNKAVQTYANEIGAAKSQASQIQALVQSVQAKVVYIEAQDDPRNRSGAEFGFSMIRVLCPAIDRQQLDAFRLVLMDPNYTVAKADGIAFDGLETAVSRAQAEAFMAVNLSKLYDYRGMSPEVLEMIKKLGVRTAQGYTIRDQDVDTIVAAQGQGEVADRVRSLLETFRQLKRLDVGREEAMTKAIFNAPTNAVASVGWAHITGIFANLKKQCASMPKSIK